MTRPVAGWGPTLADQARADVALVRACTAPSTTDTRRRAAAVALDRRAKETQCGTK